MSVGANMSETRRHLGSLASAVNVGGEESLRRRVPRERTHVERQSIRMHERREETWRPLNRRRVAAFLELYFLAMVNIENAHRYGYQTRASAKMLNKALTTRVIPWIFRHRVFTRDDRQWPISLEQFKELNVYLAANLPNIHADYKWQFVITFFKEVEREREVWKRLDELERDAMEAYERCMVILNN